MEAIFFNAAKMKFNIVVQIQRCKEREKKMFNNYLQTFNKAAMLC